jgi:hypothetical protein
VEAYTTYKVGTDSVPKRRYIKFRRQGVAQIKEYKIKVLYILIFFIRYKNKTLEWIGHVVRMDRGRTVKKIFESKLERRRRGRPRLRWLEDVEKNLRQMTVKKWGQKAVDREEWAFVIKETRAQRGP